MKLFNLPLGMSHSLFLTSLLPLLAASPLNLKRDSNSHEAPAITNNPTDIVYRADFPTFNSPNVVGIVQFYSLNGTTKVHIDLTGLPKNAGLFSYHIHESGIPTIEGMDMANACEAAGMHFNPFNAPLAKDIACDSFDNDSKCQVGDLSGKHGLINTTCFETYYYDPYISLDPSHPSFIGGKSLVLHLEDSSKLACANILPASDPEDLVLLNPESEAAQVREFVEAAYGDKTNVLYFGVEPLKKRAEDDRFDVYEDLDWGLTELDEDYEDEDDEIKLEEGDKEMTHKDIDIAPVLKNTTEYLGNKTTNGTAVNAGNTTIPSTNSSNSLSNIHIINCLRIILISMFMSLF